MRSFEYRLYPNKQQSAMLDAVLEESRLIYNEMLEAEIAHYEEHKKFLFEAELRQLFKNRSVLVPASVIQCLANRLVKALKAYFKRKKKGLAKGFPRFKGYLGWHSIHLRQNLIDFELKDKLRVPKKLGYSLKIKMHRPIEGKIKTCYLVKRIDKWYVVFACEVEPTELPFRRESVVGIDVGLKQFLVDSNGDAIENPRYFRKKQSKLQRQQRRSARRTKGSRRRRKANVQVSKTHLKIARQRRDHHFKVAKKLADTYTFIAVENLNISGMVKNKKLAKSINDAGWGQFLDILSDKAERAGGQVIRVAPQYTSQMCSRCGEIVQKSLSVRTHICPECGFIADRDHNAALNILQKGLSQQGHCCQALTCEDAHCVA